MDGDGTAAQQIAHVGSNQVSDGYVSVEIDVDIGPEFNESASSTLSASMLRLSG